MIAARPNKSCFHGKSICGVTRTRVCGVSLGQVRAEVEEHQPPLLIVRLRRAAHQHAGARSCPSPNVLRVECICMRACIARQSYAFQQRRLGSTPKLQTVLAARQIIDEARNSLHLRQISCRRAAAAVATATTAPTVPVVVMRPVDPPRRSVCCTWVVLTQGAQWHPW